MSFLQDLNPVQREAVTAVQGPVMILAGAGSGKTRVLTYRIAYLAQIGVPAYNILSLTFTNKAANEMKGRIVQLVGEKSSQVWMGTFHSIFARILRREAEKIGFQKNFTIYDADDSLRVIKTVQHDLGIPAQQFKPEGMRSRISAAKNRCITPDELTQQATDLFGEKTARVYAAYQERLQRSNAMDFDDLLLKPIELFRRHKEVLSDYQRRFRFVLVDEYQDTNRAQFEVIKLLAQSHRNICVVGDDAQSIYSFRGADIRNILDFEREFPNCSVFRLEQNYRSTKTILAAADQVIKNNIDQIKKNLWTENTDGEAISLLPCGNDREEGERIYESVQREISRKKFQLKDFAILYRTNAQSRSIEDAFRRHGVPYVILGGVAFYKRKEVKDVIAYLRLLVNPRDDESLTRIINYPSRGIGETTVAKLRNMAKSNNLPLWDVVVHPASLVGLPKASGAGVRAFASLIQKYGKLRAEMSASEISRALVDDLGILQSYKEENTTEALGRRENIQELLSAITEFSAERNGGGLEEFLQEVSLVADLDSWDDKQHAVTLMTLHSSKGLEFPVVLITGLEEGLFPYYHSFVDQVELEEERRLFYVGMTRAKQKLYLSYARERFKFGGLEHTTPSRFLQEFDQSLIERQEPHSAPRRVVRDQSKIGKATLTAQARKRGGEEAFFTDQMPDYENESQRTVGISVGARVAHEMFGNGRVVGVVGRGETAKAVVDFQSVGRKNLLLKYAHLRVL